MTLQVFNEQEVLGKDFRIYGSPDEPLFLAKDVANWIEHSDTSKMIRSVDENEKVKNNVPTLGGMQESWFLTEDGLYEVLMQSRKPIAKQFKKEVKTILKSVRKHGAYMTESTIEQALTSPDFLIQLATNLKEEQEKRKAAELLAQQQQPKVEFVDTYVDATGLHDMKSVAKILGTGRNKLFERLRSLKILMDDNKPYQVYMDKGWFEVKTTTKFNNVFSVTLVTPKGLYELAEKLKDIN